MLLGVLIHIVLGCVLGAVLIVVPLSRFTSNRLKGEHSTKQRLLIYLQHSAVMLSAIGIVMLVMRAVHIFQPHSFVNLLILVMSSVVTCGFIWRALFKVCRTG
jgi:hypothetical protein